MYKSLTLIQHFFENDIHITYKKLILTKIDF